MCTETRDAFIMTKLMFADACGIHGSQDISFSEWMRYRDDLKAAALFVIYYRKIRTAWLKTKRDYIDPEDAVSTVLQYLVKNVPIIEANPSRYAEAYVYKVAFNALMSLGLGKKKQWFYDNREEFPVDDEDRSDIFEDRKADIDRNIFSREVQKLIDTLTDEQIEVLNGILERKAVCDRKRKDAVLKELRSIFKGVKAEKEERKLTFGDIYKNDDCIESAVVILPNGKRAVYYGETVTLPNGLTRVVLFGEDRDYRIALSKASKLIVEDVEWY